MVVGGGRKLFGWLSGALRACGLVVPASGMYDGSSCIVPTAMRSEQWSLPASALNINMHSQFVLTVGKLEARDG